MTRPVALGAGRVLAEGREREGWWVTISGERVLETGPRPPRAALPVDLGPVDLVPGLVDLHSDCLEVLAHPRASMTLPLADALLELDAQVAAHGITTHFVCVCLEENVSKFRSVPRAIETVDAVASLRHDLRVDHRVHLRVDVTGEGVAAATELARRAFVGLVSYMLHLPGYGQFPDEASWRRYYRTVEGEDERAVLARLERRRARLGAVRESQAAIAGLARAGSAVLASHDDDSPEAVRRAAELGAAIVEFPVTEAAAREAALCGLGVVMGAPNARRGHSHHANLSARQALASGLLDALASDYHPPSLLAAPYALASSGACSWADAMGLVTANPARLARLTDRGRLTPGARADLVAVGRRGGQPAVTQVWVAGKEVFGT